MTRNPHFVSGAIALAALAAVSLATAPANAAVICKTAGLRQGCIVARAPVVVAPAAPVATTVTRAAIVAPVAVTHAGYTRVTPYGVRHVGYTRVWR